MICRRLNAPALAILEAINLSSSSLGIGLSSYKMRDYSIVIVDKGRKNDIILLLSNLL